MKITPFNKNKFRDIIDKIEFYENEGIPPEVRIWVDFQRESSMIERRKNLDDNDIFYSFVNLFHRIDVRRLMDKDATVYPEIADQYKF